MNAMAEEVRQYLISLHHCSHRLSSKLQQYRVGAPAGCLFDGQSVSHGASVTAYETSTVAFGQSCKAQSRTCSNGSLSGNYTYPTCSVGAPASCTFNGQTKQWSR